jgi:hypothetical protein
LQHIIDVQKNYRSEFEMLLRGKIPQRKKGFSALSIFKFKNKLFYLIRPQAILGPELPAG